LDFYHLSNLTPTLTSTPEKTGGIVIAFDGITYAAVRLYPDIQKFLPSGYVHLVERNYILTMGKDHMAANGITLSSSLELFNFPEAAHVL